MKDKQEEVGTIIKSDRPNIDDATADGKLILTIVIRFPKVRYSPGDAVVIRNCEE